jgi:hypothetical protein
MAIVAITNGTVVVHIIVDYTATDLTEIQTSVGSNPGTYSGKTFKALDTGLYHYVDGDDVIATKANTLDAGKSAVDGPIDFTTGQIDYPTLTGNTDNLDPTGSGSDGVNVLNLFNSSGAQMDIRGIVAPSTGKSMIIYNDGPDNVRLQPQNANATAANRFEVGGNLVLNDKESVMIWYDATIQRWKALRI